ncbi:c-type cytochrome [Tranquillimonas alkanivorans]|uniref:Cytochrome C oxidase, cbb3-type, subunit III n=1 Tax=Tranquillimonas alkanivorans TaxID=441119 RepID=A0A1I5RT58_9RHOB|nr:c-type cytochrome [Tranquillimonas alkanivorans]SFP61126.1 Cytochrome C oxidase, cbb3-type, subunit III [Tranquillimonas alkanivorans]
MARGRTNVPAVTALGVALVLVLPASAQEDVEEPVERTVIDAPLTPDQEDVGVDGAGQDEQPVQLGTQVRPNELVHVLVTGIYPGAVRPQVEIDVPDLTDEERLSRGKKYFAQFNCIGCHGPHGGGGMGPSLSNTTFLFGQEPENIYLTILQGRPLGMPVYGGLLPDHVIWDLVAYVRSLAKDEGAWGRTTSLDAFTVEQVPSHYTDTIRPWEHTQPFSFGQPPFEKVDEPQKTEAAQEGE